jgi:hypothetical protein
MCFKTGWVLPEQVKEASYSHSEGKKVLSEVPLHVIYLSGGSENGLFQLD